MPRLATRPKSRCRGPESSPIRDTPKFSTPSSREVDAAGRCRVASNGGSVVAESGALDGERRCPPSAGTTLFEDDSPRLAARLLGLTPKFLARYRHSRSREIALNAETPIRSFLFSRHFIHELARTSRPVVRVASSPTRNETFCARSFLMDGALFWNSRRGSNAGNRGRRDQACVVPEELEKHLILNSNRLRKFEDTRLEVVTYVEAKFGLRNS